MVATDREWMVALLQADGGLRRTGRRWIVFLRAAGVSAFFVIAAIASLEREPQWRALFPLFSVYFAFSLAMIGAAVRGHEAVSGYAVPLVDVVVVFWMQHLALQASPAGGFIAGWSVGLFGYLVVVSALTFQSGVVWLTAATGGAAETLLLAQGSLHADAMVSSAALLGLTALVARFTARRIEQSAGVVAQKDAARMQAERRAEALQAEKEQARLWTDFMVHDLRQPLTAAVAMVDVAAANASRSAPVQGELAIAAGELQRLAGMVEDLISLSCLEHGTLRPRIEQARLAPLLAAIAAAHRGEAGALGVSLLTDVPDELVAPVDEQLARRAVENLLSNALRYTPPRGHIRLHARREGTAAVIAVQNDGPRIAADVRARLFQRFASFERKSYHAGLGLYFCRVVAEAHGGSVSVGDAPGWNVEFRLRFPAQ